MFFYILIIGDTLLNELLLPCASWDRLVIVASYASLLEKPLVNDKITALCQTKCVSQALYQSLQTTTKNLCQTVSLTSFQKTNAICLNLLRVCPSMLPSVFAVLAFILIFHPVCWQFPLFEF